MVLGQWAAFDMMDHGTLLVFVQFWTGSSSTFLIIRSVSRLVLFYLMQRSFCLWCQRALSWVQYSVTYTLLPSAIHLNHLIIGFYFYTDDTQLYIHLTHNDAAHAFDRLKNCQDGVKKWLSAKTLKLNPDKTEFIIFGSKLQCGQFTSLLVNIFGSGVFLFCIFVSCNVFKIVCQDCYQHPQLLAHHSC